MDHTIFDLSVQYWLVGVPIFFIVAFLFLGFRLIPNNKIGVV